MDAAAECIPTKLRAKYRVPWETLAFKKKCYDVKTAFLRSKRNITNVNAQNFKKAQSELNNAHLKEQTEYIQDQIIEIRHSVEDRQSRITWQTINEVIRRKSTARTKLKAASQE